MCGVIYVGSYYSMAYDMLCIMKLNIGIKEKVISGLL